MTNKQSNSIKSEKWNVLAKTIPFGMSIRVNLKTIDIFLKRIDGCLVPTILQISRNQKGWTHRKIFQEKDKNWMLAKVLRFDDAEELLDRMEYNERNASAGVIDRYKSNNFTIQSDIQNKPRPERGDIITMLEAGADANDIIRIIEKIYDNEKNGVGVNIIKTVTPKQIRAILDREIVGNEHAKRTIATAVAKHVSTLGECLKTNVLITGESGTGKTEMIRALKKHREWNHNNIPIVIYDASQLTPVGWKGTNMDDIIHQVVSENPELDKVEQAIIQLDEMDKISNCDDYAPGLLKQILKLVEGGSINAGDRKSFAVTIDGQEQKVSHIDTSRMLFIISGVYAQFNNRPQEKAIGFNKTTTNESDTKINLTHEEIIKTGVIPAELMGRIQAVTKTERMSKAQWRKCVVDKILRDYQDVPAIFSMDIKDIITDNIIDEIVEKTYGSRQGLRSAINMIDAIVNAAIYEKAKG